MADRVGTLETAISRAAGRGKEGFAAQAPEDYDTVLEADRPRFIFDDDPEPVNDTDLRSRRLALQELAGE